MRCETLLINPPHSTVALCHQLFITVTGFHYFFFHFRRGPAKQRKSLRARLHVKYFSYTARPHPRSCKSWPHLKRRTCNFRFTFGITKPDSQKSAEGDGEPERERGAIIGIDKASLQYILVCASSRLF